MHDPYPIRPFTAPIDASAQLPGSKSITNRALVLAALATGETRLEGALFSRDTRLMCDALGAFGVGCESDPEAATIRVTGCGGNPAATAAAIEVGNAGTVARFVTAFAALAEGARCEIDGDPAMRKRPMAGLLDALETLGAARFDCRGEPGHLPFSIDCLGYRGGAAEVDAKASSQVLSALLMAAPAGGGETELRSPGVRPAYVEITLRMRERFGAPPASVGDGGRYTLPPARYRPPDGGVYRIEPDLSAASYFLALALVNGGRIRLPGIGASPLQGDARFGEVMSAHGLRIEADADGWQLQGPADRDTLEREREIDFSPFSDTFLTYAAIAPLLRGAVRITGIGHTRGQETDRIAGMARELAGLGQLVAEEADALTIRPNLQELRARAFEARRLGGLLEVSTYEDHRFAMSFAILGAFDLLGDGRPWLAVRDPSCCAKTFPEFFAVLEGLR